MNLRPMLSGWLALFAFAALPTFAHAQDEVIKLRAANEELKRLISEQQALLRALTDLNELKQRVLALEQKVDTLQKGSTTQPPLFAQTGNIRLENRLGVPATFIINDMPYRLQPFQTRTLTSYQAGSFTYEVLIDGRGSTGPTIRTLLPNATFSLWTY